MDLESKISQIRTLFKNDLNSALNDHDFERLYLKYFSKSNGIITKIIKELPSLSIENKKTFGPLVNQLSKEIKNTIETNRADVLNQDTRITFNSGFSLGTIKTGRLHPTTQTIREMNDFFRYYGYSIVEGPEVELDEYNFRRLNLPKDHPARDLQDTIYIKESLGILLRTHTSSVETRILSTQEPPIRVVAPGKVFRNETPNPTNVPFFHQYQGVVVDKGITIQNLKSTIHSLLQFLYGEDVVVRFRYKYYPEVSPGLGTDIRCPFCKGIGCNVCKKRGFIEILGSGMIHYNTLKMCGIDPEQYTGFAFGMGLDRLVMAKFGITDVRKLYGEGMYNL